MNQEPIGDMGMFLAEEIYESLDIARNLRMRDNAEPMYHALKQIKDLIEQEPFSKNPDEIYKGIREAARAAINRVEGWL